MLLRAVGVALGVQLWRWYCRRRHHQGFEEENYEIEASAQKDEVGGEVDLLEAEQPKSQTHASELSNKVSTKDAEARPQQNSAASAAPELSRHTASKSADEGSLLIHIPGNEASPSNTPAQQSPALQSPNRHIERLKEQVTQSTDTPWPGICHISSPTTQKAQMPWPGLEMSQTSTAEAEGPTLVRTGSDSPPEAYSPTWVQAEGTHSPDSPLSLSEAVSRRASRAKRGRQRTYFNSSRSISSAESSPRAPAAPATDPTASLAAHSLRSYVRSPRWAEQPGNTNQSPQGNVYRVPAQSPFAMASPPVRMRILSAPEQREDSPLPNVAGARLGFPSADSLEDAPTEAGFHLDGHIDKVLSELQDEGERQQLRRYSRSFSEPNLALHFLQAKLQEENENAKLADSSEEDSDADNVMTRLQGTVEAVQDNPQLKAVLKAKLSQGEDSGHSSSSNGGPPPEGPSAEERAARQKRAREECSEPPAPIRVDVADSGSSTQLFFSANPVTYEVSIGRLSDNSIALSDNEVSGHHAAICWECSCRCWQVMDLGSLNGTSLNGRIISTSNRRRGRLWRLNDGDEIKLGVRSTLKITYLPLQDTRDGFPRTPTRVISGRALLKIPTMPCEAFAAITPKPGGAGRESRLLLRDGMLRMEAWAASSLGREHARLGTGMEDVITCTDGILRPSMKSSCLLTMLDGHCGRKAADEVAQELPRDLGKRLMRHRHSLAAGQGAGSAWSEAFLATDASIKAEEGCTATALLIWVDEEGQACMQAANVGDSAAVYAQVPAKRKLGPQVQALTEDHRLTNASERQRLADMGIRMKTNHTRLYGLNLSRCLGDKFLKNEDLGLSAEPHVSAVLRFDPGQRGIALLASDGLWDVVEPPAAMKLAMEAYHASGRRAQAVAEALLDQAQKQRSKDDVSVIAIVFGGHCDASAG